MTIDDALSDLSETWSYTKEELSHIRDLMEEIKKTAEQESKRITDFYGSEFLAD